MEFNNQTPFPAQNFAGVDQHEQDFHVVVVRQTLTWDDNGTLVYADEQLPLCEEDQFAGRPNESCVLQESDYCQYKPKCDVIVNATAYAPQGRPSRWFDVRLLVKRPDKFAPASPRPQGLNQFVAPSQAVLDKWSEENRNPKLLPDTPLVDKRLQVSGERRFVRHVWPLRLASTMLKIATIGLVRLPTWWQTRPSQVVSVPISREYAFGGQCRINVNQQAALRVSRKYLLTPEQFASQPAPTDETDSTAIALSACEANTVGRGFVRQWYVRAMRLSVVHAPQITQHANPVTARHFVRALDGKLDNDTATSLTAGFGVRPKGHPLRRVLVGTVNEVFAKSEAWLPEDFDFAVWNAAEPDQQTEFLKGDEVIELTNLCLPNAPGTRVDERGNTMLQLQLPKNECHVLVRLFSGEIFISPMIIDTLIVDPDKRLISVVWRVVLADINDAPIRAVEARMYSFNERDRVRAQIEKVKMQMTISDLDTNASDQLEADRISHA